MQLTAQILLDTTPEQAEALKRTLRETNTCCDFMGQRAFERKVFSRLGLQKIAYRKTRETFRPWPPRSSSGPLPKSPTPFENSVAKKTIWQVKKCTDGRVCRGPLAVS